MNFLLLVAILVVLFYLLGKFADVVIINVRKLGEDLGVRLFFLGIILGIFTSLPELSVGINALLDNIQEISLGNLFGGVIVLFTLILGGSAILNRRLATDEILKELVPILSFLFLPPLLGLKGSLGLLDGVLILLAYLGLIFYLFKKNNKLSAFGLHIVSKQETAKRIFFILAGIALLMLVSKGVIEVTEALLAKFVMPGFLAGLVFFAVGTNLPEISLIFRSWRRHLEELSLSNLFGSAMANMMLVGIFSSMQELTVKINSSYIFLLFTYFIVFGLLLMFFRTDRRLKRSEGLVLALVYLIFLITQLFFIFEA